MKLIQNTGSINTSLKPRSPAMFRGFRVEWLPSISLIEKHKAPSISGWGIIYSEALERTLSVFETENLVADLNQKCHDQARALAIDPDCRVYWLNKVDEKTAQPEITGMPAANCG